ncbi:MAG: type II 3-dehydroquinate dehydratase [Candidatus Poribacteria bacterium]|nr:type II 3-dehydroquinate dehydratase [Candidatus Poribacteria bacterium]
MNILVLHGPNLHLLGKRQPEIYGHQTLNDINSALDQFVASSPHDVVLKILQSNHEGEIVSIIGDHIEWVDGILINPAAYTHTSIAIRDALSTVAVPVVEVHLSNIYSREEFRHHSYISGVAAGVVSGFGAYTYILGLEAMIHILGPKTNET